MDVVECLEDIVALFNPMNLFDKFLVLVGFINLFVRKALLALKCILIYFHEAVLQLDKRPYLLYNFIVLDINAIPKNPLNKKRDNVVICKIKTLCQALSVICSEVFGIGLSEIFQKSLCYVGLISRG